MRPPLPIARGLKRSRVLQRRGGFHPTSSSEGRKNIMPVTLLISVGGAPGPIVYSIRRNQPECIIFFVSAASRRVVSGEILPQLLQDPGRLPDHEFIVTPDEQDLGLSTFVLMNEVPAALRRLNVTDVEWPQLVDYTGGTKTMSASVVWASSRYPCVMSYIGAADAGGRTREGLGTVVDGREVCILRQNTGTGSSEKVSVQAETGRDRIFRNLPKGHWCVIHRIFRCQTSEDKMTSRERTTRCPDASRPCSVMVIVSAGVTQQARLRKVDPTRRG